MTNARSKSPPSAGGANANASADANADSPLLLRKHEATHHFPALDATASQFSRSLRDLLRALGAPTIQVERERSVQMDFSEWLHGITPALYWRFHTPALKGPLYISASRNLVLQLVDIFYGGKGQLVADREELTDAEERFSTRLGRDMALQLAAAWRDKLVLEPELDVVTADINKISPMRSTEELVVQKFIIKGAPFEGRAILCAYPLSAMRGIAAAEPIIEPNSDASRDPLWTNTLHKAVKNVRLPVRSVLARPEIPLVKLLSLEVGDIIPLTIPRHVPVTVAGRRFASGNIGESNGNVAIMIEHLEEGSEDE